MITCHEKVLNKNTDLYNDEFIRDIGIIAYQALCLEEDEEIIKSASELLSYLIFVMKSSLIKENETNKFTITARPSSYAFDFNHSASETEGYKNLKDTKCEETKFVSNLVKYKVLDDEGQDYVYDTLLQYLKDLKITF